MKLHLVNSSRKEYTCAKCMGTIEAGEEYLWWQPYKHRVIRWHKWHGNPPRSELTGSEKVSLVYRAQEILIDYFNGLLENYDLYHDKQALKENVDQANIYFDQALELADNVADQYSESAGNVYKRFGETAVVKSCLEKADKISNWTYAITDIYNSWNGITSKMFKNLDEHTGFNGVFRDYINECLAKAKELNL